MIVGLDVSTAFVGITIIKDDDANVPNVVLLDHLDFKGCRSLLDKTDRLRTYLHDIASRYPGVTKVVIEDAAKRYASGKTSMETIGTLIRFNGLATYLAYDAFDVHPSYIAAAKARKACGIKVLQRKHSGGLGHKEQTFNTIMATDLAHVTWPTKPKGGMVPWAYDVVDSYVIAKSERAGLSVPA
jgi:hypothetical protein